MPEQHENKRKLKKGDLFLVLLVAIIGIPLVWRYFGVGETKRGEHLTAVITRDGKQRAVIDLNDLKKPKYVEFTKGIGVTILAEKGTIKFLRAQCPDQICVKTGALTKPGDQAICLPSRTIVTIREDEGD